MASLPSVGGDAGTWGTKLNDYLTQQHTATGAHGAITATSITTTAQGKFGGNVTVGGKFDLDVGLELTIASRAVTVTKSFHFIDTEGNAATDHLETINGGKEGMILVLSAAHPDRTVVLCDGTGNLNLAGHCTLDHSQDTIVLISIGNTWRELCRSNNA